MPRFTLLALALIFAGTAATVQSATIHSAKEGRRDQAAAQRGEATAKARCAACHAVTANGSSPNPESPAFEDIANRSGLTTATLRQYLRDAHNYPDAMQFRLNRNEARDLSAYLITLKRPGHKPAI